MISQEEIKSLQQRGIDPSVVESQIERFEKGFKPLRLECAATIGHGIVALDSRDENQCLKQWKSFLLSGHKIEKFVPASGAASRMFKDLFAFMAKDNPIPETDFERQFFEQIHHFAFFSMLDKTCVALYGKNVDELIKNNEHAAVVKALLSKEGMNYGALPKALLRFHKLSSGSVHTPLEEHLEEGAQYAASGQQHDVNIHFTVSPEHRDAFNRLLRAKVPYMEKIWGVNYHITMSEQKASTDTIAVTEDNKPFHDADGQLLLRPAGHGALLENLNERDADVIFIKNIDNVVPSSARHTTTRYKKVLAGYLVRLQQRVAQMLSKLDEGNVPKGQLLRMLQFVENDLYTVNEKAHEMDEQQLAEYLKTKLNRPLRVCGMVKNEGEPGGGPYLAYNADGSYSPQVLEAAQIDPNSTTDMEMMKSGTHFNPVDLVCYIKDYQGNRFNLKEYVDPETGLISLKSKDGVTIKALELPGLWNGSMSDWITVFVEVPIDTFNPVKTVNDLLRPIHQTIK